MAIGRTCFSDGSSSACTHLAAVGGLDAVLTRFVGKPRSEKVSHLAAVCGLDAVQAQVLDEQRVGVLRYVRRVPRQQLQEQLHLACTFPRHGSIRVKIGME